MSVKLTKGQKVSLTKERAGLSHILVGLGWDEAKPRLALFGGKRDIDCDAFALLLQNGKLMNKGDIIYFNNQVHQSEAVRHMGDNLTGAGEGDDEQMLINLAKIPPAYDRIVIAANIYESVKRSQHFGMIKNAFIRLVDGKDNKEMCIYNLTDDYAHMTAIIFGEVYRRNGEWKFSAIGQGTKDASISEFSKRYL